MKRTVFLTSFSVALILVPFDWSDAADSRLVGIWSTETYVIDGKEHPMEGIFIFTDRHFSANTFFRVSGGEMEDANANAGTYRTEGDRLVLMQDVQIHIRPGDPKEPIFYGKQVEEAATYAIEGDRLEITFPSTNRYLCRRIQ
jgi:hypothetical protein